MTTETTEETIQRLLREGLDLYGVDEVTAAIQTWQKVLELDPGNNAALDYLQTADRRKHPRGSAPASVAATGGADGGAPVVQEAQMLLRLGEFAGAVALLEGADAIGSGGLEHQGLLDLARSRLYGAYCEQVRDLARVPRVHGSTGDLTRFDLPRDAGFVLSMIDGETCLEDLIALSGMDALSALHTLCGLLEAGIVELAE